MKAISEHLFRRGSRGTLYLRRRIPTDLHDAFPPGKREVIRSLRTSDETVARRRLRAESSKLDELFERARQRLEDRWKRRELRTVHTLTDEQLDELALGWVHAVLQTDEEARRDGLDDAAFADLGERIKEQLADVGAMLAQGRTDKALPAMYGYFHLCGIDARLSPDDERRAAYRYLEAVVRALELQAERHAGKVRKTAEVAPPPSQATSWQDVFATWRDYVHERPKTTTLACQTAWRALEAFCKSRDVLWPAHVTPALMTAFVDHMRSQGLAPKTVNERLRKVRAVYRIAIGKSKLSVNPAVETLGVKLATHHKGRERRMPFSATDLQTLFGSPIYLRHLRSRGQSGEASYWLPLFMYYTGARPEEIAGLEVADLKEQPGLGWYMEVTDLPSPEDAGLFESSEEGPPDHGRANRAIDEETRRRLKNTASRRRVPLPQPLLELGLLRYADTVRAQGQRMLFPELTRDTHGKLSGAHSKFFGRYLRQELGIDDPRKTLYSLRHSFKDVMQAARVPVRVSKRLMGHASGDGAVHDGYGSDLPLEQLFENVRTLRFAALPAAPWERGRGAI